MRASARILQQVQPVPLVDGGTATSYVRRVNDPLAQVLHLGATISSSRVNELQVSIGVIDPADPGNPHLVQVFDRGAIRVTCTTTTDGATYGGTRNAVVAKSDGLDLLFDLRTCTTLLSGLGNAFAGERNWIVQVTATQRDGNYGYIDSLTMNALGRTSPLLADT